MWAGCKGAIGIVEEPNLASKGAIATPRPEGTGERTGWQGTVVLNKSL